MDPEKKLEHPVMTIRHLADREHDYIYNRSNYFILFESVLLTTHAPPFEGGRFSKPLPSTTRPSLRKAIGWIVGLAERVRFELTVPLRARRFSRPLP